MRFSDILRLTRGGKSGKGYYRRMPTCSKEAVGVMSPKLVDNNNLRRGGDE